TTLTPGPKSGVHFRSPPERFAPPVICGSPASIRTRPCRRTRRPSSSRGGSGSSRRRTSITVSAARGSGVRASTECSPIGREERAQARCRLLGLLGTCVVDDSRDEFPDAAWPFELRFERGEDHLGLTVEI